MKYEEIRGELKTGDVVLFGGKGGVSDLIKYFSGSDYSHIGMVMDVPEWDFKCVWESTTLSNLTDLDTGLPTKGVQLVPLSSRIQSYEGNVAIRQLLGGNLPHDAVARLMKLRKLLVGRPYERSQAELMKSLYDGPFGLNEADLSSVFCSEIMAEGYKELSLLDCTLPSNEFTPADFSAKSKLQLLNGFYLSEEHKIHI